MRSIKVISSVILVLIAIFSVQTSNSQMKMGAGTFNCTFNGDALSFGLNSDFNDLYYMSMGGTADFGLIKIQWDGAKTPADVKVMTLKMANGFVQDEKEKISVIWADFYTNIPYII